MSKPICPGVNTAETNNKTRSLDRQELSDVDIAGSSQIAPITTEEVARHIRAVNDPLSKELELLCDLMKELRQARLRRNKNSSGLIQGSSPSVVCKKAFDAKRRGRSKK